MTARPASAVPVAAKVGGAGGDHDYVRVPRMDLLVATRARVGLAGLIGLDAPHLGVEPGDRVHGCLDLEHRFRLGRLIGPDVADYLHRRGARKLPDVDIDGSSAIVTGGASGLGAASARALADRGVRVVIADVQDAPGEALAKELGGVFAHVDVTSTEQVIAAVETASASGPLRLLVNCAGIGSAARTIGRDGTFESAFDLPGFEKVISVNLVGTFNCIRLAATAMSRNDPLADGERGAIVNTASIAAFEGQIGQAAYSASKGGIIGMTLTIARDLAAVGVRVNTIAPGLVDTPIYGTGPGSEAFKEKLKRDVVFPKRLGHATEFASLAVEVLTNSYINGEVIRVDGAARLQPK